MAENSASKRAKIQEILDNNTIRAGGDFHSDELTEETFIIELQNNFKLTSEKDGETHDLRYL